VEKMSLIEIKNVYKIFGKAPHQALKKVREGVDKDQLLRDSGHNIGVCDLSLDIEAGEIFVIMGLSGSGKSTLVRHLNRLIDPTAGSIVVDGQNIMEFDKKELREFRRRTVSMVFQKFGLLPHENILQNVAYGLKVRGMTKVERNKVAQNWVERVGLKGYERSFPRELSGGMQQRVGLARALATNPRVLLMDEPFSALDPLIRREMQDVLIELQKDVHKTIVFITHDLDEALRIGDRIAILKDGKLVQCGDPQTIVNHPADNYVEAFVRDVRQKQP
jgi:glycine betaine/proline transport system ATP-binding protein